MEKKRETALEMAEEKNEKEKKACETIERESEIK